MKRRYGNKIFDFLLEHPCFAGFYALCAGVFLWMTLIEPNLLTTRTFRFESARFPETLSPLRIAVVGDLHAGPDWGRSGRLDAIADTVNSGSPDLIFLLGDYVNYHGGEVGNLPMADFTAFLRRLRAPYGVFGVPGNHEMWYGLSAVRRAFAEAGATLLENRCVNLSLPGGTLTVAGLGERNTGAPDPVRTLAGAAPGAPVLLLTHNPKVFQSIALEGVVLSFCAHTHGGQVRFPAAAGIPFNFWSGGYHPGLGNYESGGDLFLTSGIGGNPVRIRLFCPPEVAFVTVAAAAGQAVPEPVTI